MKLNKNDSLRLEWGDVNAIEAYMTITIYIIKILEDNIKPIMYNLKLPRKKGAIREYFRKSERCLVRVSFFQYLKYLSSNANETT